jgi:hypothetical protein
MVRVRDAVRTGSYRKAVQSSDWVGYLVADILGMDAKISAPVVPVPLIERDRNWSVVPRPTLPT